MRKQLKKTALFLAMALVMSMVLAVAAAAQEVDIKINFQRGTDREAPEGYLIDAGEEFGERNGLNYGWNTDHTGQARDNNNANEDRRLATHLHFTEGSNWSIEVPNGTYEVTVSIGDAAYPTGDKGKLILKANDVTVFEFAEGEKIEMNTHKQNTVEVKVTDGKLVLDPLDSAQKNIKINYIEIKSLSLDQAAEEPAAETPAGSDNDGATSVPDMPKTGMGGTSGGNSAMMIVIVFMVAAGAAIVLRKKAVK